LFRWDIDLTTLSCQNIKDGLVSNVHVILYVEEISEAIEYEVKDVSFMDAEFLLQWEKGGTEAATWKDVATMKGQFPDFNLE